MHSPGFLAGERPAYGAGSIPLRKPSDGLHPDRSNENKGESVHRISRSVEIRQLVATAAVVRTKPASKLSSNGNGTSSSRSPPGASRAPPKSEPPEPVSAPDPARVVVRPSQTGDRARETSTRRIKSANHIVDRVLGSTAEASAQHLREVLENFGSASESDQIFEARPRRWKMRSNRMPVDKTTTPPDRLIFSKRTFVRGIGPVQSRLSSASRPDRRA